MFELFWNGLQQDIKLAVLPPIVCALFRLVFILWYSPQGIKAYSGRKLYHCFRYGFWWGMDFNAYAFLIPMLLVSLPGAFFEVWYESGNTVRTFLMTAYLVALYMAFFGKMVVYYHFHDVYNRNVWLGKNADKKNLADIFFNQNHGLWILLSFVPYTAIAVWLCGLMLSLPNIGYVQLSNEWLQYGLNTVVFLGAVLMFYWFRFGGTLKHRNKPEWDEVPPIVKEDVFLGKATMDDLVSLEIVLKHPVPDFVGKDDTAAIESIRSVAPAFDGSSNPLSLFRHKTHGAQITKPRHIFFVLGESHCQTLFDDIYSQLHLADASKKFLQEKGSLAINNFQPGGMISQTALGTLLLGFYDCDVELNENNVIWNSDLEQIPTAMAPQLKRLGYKTSFWYGGSLNWGSLMHFVPAVGFDEAHGGPDFCPEGSPATWLGVYDHIFLQETAKKIKADDQGGYEFHFVYTTSNHGPYNMPYHEYGLDIDELMPEMPESLRRDDTNARRFMGACYSDRAIMSFVREMQEAYPDSLFIISGDHSSPMVPYNKGILPRADQSIRERMLTSFYMSHPELEAVSLSDLGEHLSILPTICELIAPAGFEYYGLKPSLLEAVDHVVTPYSWMDDKVIGFYEDQASQQMEPSAEPVETKTGTENYTQERSAWQDITGWLLRHPEILT